MPRQYIEIEEEQHWLFRYITFLCRIFGIITILVIWWSTIETLARGDIPFIGWYCLGMAILFTFIECIWLLDKCRCCDDGGCCCTIWKIFVWIDAWKKTIVYIAISIPMFLQEYRIFYSLLPGGFIVVCGALYLMKTCKHCRCGRRQRLRTRYGDQESPEVASSYTQPPTPPASNDTTPLSPKD